MVRTAQFSEQDFIDAATALVAEGGPTAATLTAIARRAGAPTGSVYHRFASRADILARAWLAAFAGFLDAVLPALDDADPTGAATAMIRWAGAHPAPAALVLLYDVEALLDGGAPEEQRVALVDGQRRLDEAFRHCGTRTFGGPMDEQQAAWLRFVIFDGPIALLRPHLSGGGTVPDWVADMAAWLPAEHMSIQRREQAADAVLNAH